MIMIMMLNIICNHISRHFLPIGQSDIAVFPKFSFPKNFNFRRLPKCHACADTLQHLYQVRDIVAKRNCQKNTNIIFRYFLHVCLKILMPRNLHKHISYSSSKITTQNTFSIFWALIIMIVRIIYSMTSSFQFLRLWVAYLALPSAREFVIPVYKRDIQPLNSIN